VYILILGPPGSGKGTQGQILAERLSIPKIATGDLLRDAARAGTSPGRTAKAYMDRGELVPDEVVLRMLSPELDRAKEAGGAVFDGFPRTTAQAEAVDEMLAERGDRLSHVLLFDVPEEEVVRRLLHRGAFERRSDDDLPTIRRRLAVYQQSTAPLVAYYQRRDAVHRVPAAGSVDEIADQVKRVLGR